MKLYLRAWSTGLLACLLFTTCRQEEMVEKRDYPRLRETTVVAIDEKGATFKGTILSSGREAIVDHGFVWRKGWANDPDLKDLSLNQNDLERISLGSFSGGTTFEATATYGLLPGQTYWVRSYLVTRDGFIVYSQPASLASAGSSLPTITQIEPSTAVWGDTITLIGTNFSYLPATLSVTFDEWYTAKIVSSTATTIRCIVPDQVNRNDSKVTVKNIVGPSTSPGTFSLDTSTPVITGFSPTVATYGDIITITGKNFTGDSKYWRVVFRYGNGWGETQAPVDQMTPTEIRARVPVLDRKFYTIKVVRLSNSGKQYESELAPQVFSQPPPKINTVELLSDGAQGERVRITGSGFNKPLVNFAGNTANIINSTGTEILIDPIDGIYPKPTNLVQVEVTSAEQIDSRQVSLTYSAPWIKRASRSFGAIPASAQPLTTFAIQGSGYILASPAGFDQAVQVYRFNPTGYEWHRVADVPLISGYAAGVNKGSFVINNQAYVLINRPNYSYDNTNFWKYSPATNTWTTAKAPDLTTQYYQESAYAMCSLGNKGYLFTKDNSGSLWEFDATKETWERRRTHLLTTASSFFSGVFTMDNKLYVVALNYNIGSIYCYDPANNDWQFKTSFSVTTGSDRQQFIAYSYQNVGYIINSAEAFRFDPSTNQVRLLSRNRAQPTYGSGSLSGFSHQQKAFLMTNSLDFWEVTPE